MTESEGRDPGALYKSRTVALSAVSAALRRQHVFLGYIRLALVLTGLAVAWFAFHQRSLSPWWMVLPISLFVVIARRHSAVVSHSERTQRALRFYQRGLARIEDRWAALPAQHSSSIDSSDSLFANDLDLLRPGGLFDLLDTARTSIGSETLAAWLLHPSQPDSILERQVAVAELRELSALRENLASAGSTDFEQLNLQALADWARTEQPVLATWWRPVAIALLAVTIAATVWFFATDRGWPLLIAIVVDAIVTFSLQRTTRQIFAGAESASRALRLASVLIELWEKDKLSSPLLQRLQAQLAQDSRTASASLRRLALLDLFIEQRANYILRILDAPLLYSVQLASAAQAWRRRHGSAVESWLLALGQLEALASLATYSFEHPADPFPEVCSACACFDAQGLGHPLLPAAACVRNDVRLDADTRLLLVSGSNMSGKSTLLRAVGVNTVLAMAGAPVRAARLRIAPLHVAASIQVNDSLREGRSRFYSEILRLRAVCALAERQPVLFLLDELLDGTNSSDRLTGAAGIARALLATGSIGLISTHDLALTEIATGNSLIRNVHFQELIKNGEMHFEFHLREGVATTRNGVALMRMIGLNV